MRRLYYVADYIDETQAVCQALSNEGIDHWQVHVLSKDEAGLYTHKVHSASPLQQLDIVHTALRFAVIGAICGLLLGLMLYVAGVMSWINFSVAPWTIGLLALLGTLFGAWEGGMVGLSRENYKIERYHDEIEQGKYLLMIDVRDAQRPLVREMMNLEFEHVPYRGASSPFVNPLHKPRRLHRQTTH